MNLSNIIATMISDMLGEQDEIEIQRNTLAQSIGCVPSQINYVLSSRFTPEHGYIVESRRGGGGCIRITRIGYDLDSLLMDIISSLENEADEKLCRSYIANLCRADILDKNESALILSAVSDNALRCIPTEYRNTARASIFKQMLLAVLQKK